VKDETPSIQTYIPPGILTQELGVVSNRVGHNTETKVISHRRKQNHNAFNFNSDANCISIGVRYELGL